MSYSSIKPKKDLNTYLRIRPKGSIPQNIKDEIKMVTFDKRSGDANIYGSFSYVLQKYAADIDLYEEFYPVATKEGAISKFEKSLIEMVKEIKKKREHWFSEYKTGLDNRYDIDIGDLENGIFYMKDNIERIIDDMFRNKLLSRKEVKLLGKCIKSVRKNNKNAEAYDVMYNIFRERRILRWTENEILEGKKKLPDNKIVTLNSALHDKAHVKIDEIIILDGKFVEITNYVFLGYKKFPNIDVPINIPKINYDIVVNGLKTEIEKLYFSDFYYSPFKVVKRIFALARFIYLQKNIKVYGDDLVKIIPFVSSNVSHLYQMKAELEAMLRVFEVSKTIPKKMINNQIDNLKIGISNVVELNDNDIESLNKHVDLILKADSKIEKRKLIKELIEHLKFLINFLTINYFNKIDFNPPPDDYYPKKIKYKEIKRKPFDNQYKKSELIKLYKKL